MILISLPRIKVPFGVNGSFIYCPRNRSIDQLTVNGNRLQWREEDDVNIVNFQERKTLTASIKGSIIKFCPNTREELHL